VNEICFTLAKAVWFSCNDFHRTQKLCAALLSVKLAMFRAVRQGTIYISTLELQ
jgi:hypothetical protein